jgi:hypothetical protein
MPLSGWSLGKVVRRLFLCLGLAIAFLAVFSLLFILSVRTGIEIPFRWVGLAMFTSLLLWALLRSYKDYWRRPTWWLALASLLALHLLVFVPILQRYPKWSVIWFLPVVVVEVQIFSLILDRLFTWRNKRERHSGRASERW